jgi:GNAT superfamily N-acetyltransferase
MTGRPSVHRFEDPQEFLDRAVSFLAANPVVTSVLATVAQSAADRGSAAEPGVPRWWASLEDGDEVVGLAMRCAPWRPFPVYVSVMPDAAAHALADALLDADPTVAHVNGARPAADLVAGRLAQASGARVEEAMHLRLFELCELHAHIDPPGSWRCATREDMALVSAWFGRFHADADEQADRPPDVDPPHFGPGELEARLDDGLVGLWCDEAGTPVHLTGWNAPTQGIVRVGPVFTPPGQRGKGYAAAAVARASAAALAAGHRPVLFTDQANPTSNALYQRLGYRTVTDMVNLRLAER